MTHMTKAEAEALASFVSRARPEWRHAGIMAALEKTAPTGDVWDVARALINLASEPSVLTPGLLDKPGPHWRNPAGQLPPRRGDHNVPCPDHPTEHDQPCPAPREPVDPDVIAQVRAALATAPKYVPDAVKRAQHLENQEAQ